jgi:hypothetical protein
MCHHPFALHLVSHKCHNPPITPYRKHITHIVIHPSQQKALSGSTNTAAYGTRAVALLTPLRDGPATLGAAEIAQAVSVVGRSGGTPETACAGTKLLWLGFR